MQMESAGSGGRWNSEQRVELSLAIWSVPRQASLSGPGTLGMQARGNCPERTTRIPPQGNEDRGLWARLCSVTDTCADWSQH